MQKTTNAMLKLGANFKPQSHQILVTFWRRVEKKALFQCLAHFCGDREGRCGRAGGGTGLEWHLMGVNTKGSVRCDSVPRVPPRLPVFPV